ncbi:MAG: hypothetical protein ACYCSP_14680 [Acidobacteriaceae bacterium]
MKPRMFRGGPLFLYILAFATTAGDASSHSHVVARSSAYDRVIHIHMHNVLFRVMDNVVLQVTSVNGIVTPSRRNAIVSLDDKNSFSLNMQTATTSISSANLTALVNGFILPRAKTSLKNLSFTFNPDQSIQVKGDFHKVVDVPFSATATLHATPDGNMQMHMANMTVAGVIHQDLLDVLGIKISTVAQPKRQQSFQIVGNDIIFPIDQMFPPPHVHGHLQDVNISGSELNLAFGSGKQHDGDRQSAAENPPTTAESYIYFRGGTMKFALLTMSPVDLELVPLKPDREKSFEFSVDDYYRQLVGGYSKSLPNKGLLVYMADERAIQPSTQPAQKQSK